MLNFLDLVKKTSFINERQLCNTLQKSKKNSQPRKKKILEEETNPVSYCVTKAKQKHNLEDN